MICTRFTPTSPALRWTNHGRCSHWGTYLAARYRHAQPPGGHREERHEADGRGAEVHPRQGRGAPRFEGRERLGHLDAEGGWMIW